MSSTFPTAASSTRRAPKSWAKASILIAVLGIACAAPYPRPVAPDAEASPSKQLKDYGERHMKAAEQKQKQATKDYDNAKKLPPDMVKPITELIWRRQSEYSGHIIFLKQLIAIGSGTPQWRVGPYVPLDVGSVEDNIPRGMNSLNLVIRQRSDTAGRLAYAMARGDTVGRARREAMIADYGRLIDAMHVSDEGIDLFLKLSGRPPAATIYAEQLAAIETSNARRAAATAARARDNEIGASLWVAIGALFLAGKVVNQVLIDKQIAEYRERCEASGRRFVDRYDTIDRNKRVIECR